MAEVHAGGRTPNLSYGGAALTCDNAATTGASCSLTTWLTQLPGALSRVLPHHGAGFTDIPDLMVASDRNMDFELSTFVVGGTSNYVFTLLNGPSFWSSVTGSKLTLTPTAADEADLQHVAIDVVEDGVSVATDGSNISVVPPVPNALIDLVGVALDDTRIEWSNQQRQRSWVQVLTMNGHEIAECGLKPNFDHEDLLPENDLFRRKVVAVGAADDPSSSTPPAQTATLVKQPRAEIITFTQNRRRHCVCSSAS